MQIKYASLRLLLLALACVCFSKLASAQAVYPPSETITYQSFDNGALTLRAFSGRHIRYALPASWLEGGGTQGLTPAELVSLIERTDAVYDAMAGIVGGEPKGAGLLLIPVTPLSTAENGLAVAGTKRMEVAERIRDRVKVALAEGRLQETSHTSSRTASPSTRRTCTTTPMGATRGLTSGLPTRSICCAPAPTRPHRSLRLNRRSTASPAGGTRSPPAQRGSGV